jgi:pyridoxine/pyridoxamine 5'-phosphate oxidase
VCVCVCARAPHSTGLCPHAFPSMPPAPPIPGYDDRGFAFFTNYSSRKGRELDGSGRAALAFWWEGLQRAVRVEGLVERLPGQESDAYYASRPRGSRIGAWVSEQSSVLQTGRTELEERCGRCFAVGNKYRREDEDGCNVGQPEAGGCCFCGVYTSFWAAGRAERHMDQGRG